jgi:arginyl-tRNA synthetase
VIRDDIEALLLQAARSARQAGLLPEITLPTGIVERPSNSTHGDYATSLPLRLARAARMRPLDIARAIVSHLPSADLFDRVEVVAPGFINFTLSQRWLSAQVGEIARQGGDFGHVDLGKGQSVQVEFVSANPTGPLTAASGRGGALGDALANILGAAGYRAYREYYVNDAGNQMELFNQTVYARYLQALGREAEIPEEGYRGTYMAELARAIAAREGDRYLEMSTDYAPAELGALAREMLLVDIHSTVDVMGIGYDVWFSERGLYDRGLIDQCIGFLRERGFVGDRDGAVWLLSTALGQEKDDVLIRTNGLPTYFAADIAYHYDKFKVRGLDRVIDIWGADHAGHVPRMKAAVTALEADPDSFDVIIHQMITLIRDGAEVKISKRTGNIVTLREVLEEVGADACRFFFLSRSADAHMDFDLDLAKKQSDENPVFYVQMAHARVAGILRYGAGVDFSDGDLSLLNHKAELALVRKMLEFPELVEMMARKLEPHHLPHYAQDLAAILHSFYPQCRVVSDDIPLTKARLRLMLAVKTVLGNALGLMGISAPEEMRRAEGEAS